MRIKVIVALLELALNYVSYRFAGVFSKPCLLPFLVILVLVSLGYNKPDYSRKCFLNNRYLWQEKNAENSIEKFLPKL